MGFTDEMRMIIACDLIAQPYSTPLCLLGSTEEATDKTIRATQEADVH